MLGAPMLGPNQDAPNVLRDEALNEYCAKNPGKAVRGFSKVLGSSELVCAEKAILANSSA